MYKKHFYFYNSFITQVISTFDTQGCHNN